MEGLPVLRVFVAEALGQQGLDAATGQLRLRVPEHLLRLGVGERDVPFAVYDRDGVGNGIHERRKIGVNKKIQWSQQGRPTHYLRKW
jgi:hypothetical protein